MRIPVVVIAVLATASPAQAQEGAALAQSLLTELEAGQLDTASAKTRFGALVPDEKKAFLAQFKTLMNPTGKTLALYRELVTADVNPPAPAPAALAELPRPEPPVVVSPAPPRDPLPTPSPVIESPVVHSSLTETPVVIQQAAGPPPSEVGLGVGEFFAAFGGLLLFRAIEVGIITAADFEIDTLEAALGLLAIDMLGSSLVAGGIAAAVGSLSDYYDTRFGHGALGAFVGYLGGVLAVGVAVAAEAEEEALLAVGALSTVLILTGAVVGVNVGKKPKAVRAGFSNLRRRTRPDIARIAQGRSPRAWTLPLVATSF